MTNLIPTLLFIAALALLPPWLVGGAALGAAVALWLLGKAKKAKQQAAREAAHARAVERAERQAEALARQDRKVTYLRRVK